MMYTYPIVDDFCTAFDYEFAKSICFVAPLSLDDEVIDGIQVTYLFIYLFIIIVIII